MKSTGFDAFSTIRLICLLKILAALSGCVHGTDYVTKKDIQTAIDHQIRTGDSMKKIEALLGQFGASCSYDHFYPRYYCSAQDPNPYLPKNYLSIIRSLAKV
ncbi:MAG: hypothetical protein VXW65_12280 [Pseudomonadota bacterium]|nr:hypothetical protein [Pseudomonadota bacterium]